MSFSMGKEPLFSKRNFTIELKIETWINLISLWVTRLRHYLNITQLILHWLLNGKHQSKRYFSNSINKNQNCRCYNQNSGELGMHSKKLCKRKNVENWDIGFTSNDTRYKIEPSRKDKHMPRFFRLIYSFLLKTVEKLIYRHTGDDVSVNSIHQDQYAYQAGKSGKLSIHMFMEGIERALCSSEIVLWTFLDIKEHLTILHLTLLPETQEMMESNMKMDNLHD